MQLQITQRGRELVQTPEFTASLIEFMKDWEGTTDEGTEQACRLIVLAMCEIDPEHGPALDSPKLEQFCIEHQGEIEEAAAPVVDLLLATQKCFLN